MGNSKQNSADGRQGINTPGHGIESILRGDPSAQNIEQIAVIEKEALRKRSFAERIGDFITKHFGTMTVLLFHVAWFAIWICINMGWISAIKPFDPFPYGLLTTIVSLEAIFMSIVLLISQNRMTRQADNRAHLNLQIDLLEEQEMTRVLKTLRLISERLGITEEDMDDEPGDTEHLLKKTDVHKLMNDMEKKMPA